MWLSSLMFKITQSRGFCHLVHCMTHLAVMHEVRLGAPKASVLGLALDAQSLQCSSLLTVLLYYITVISSSSSKKLRAVSTAASLLLFLKHSSERLHYKRMTDPRSPVSFMAQGLPRPHLSPLALVAIIASVPTNHAQTGLLWSRDVPGHLRLLLTCSETCNHFRFSLVYSGIDQSSPRRFLPSLL